MRRWTALLLAGLMLLASACGGEGGESVTTDSADTETARTLATEATEATEATDTAEATDVEEPDNCSLVTSEEATSLAGYELEVGEDSAVGCGYIPPGSSVADLTVNTSILDGDAASAAAQGFPNAAEMIPVDVGEDTVAVTTPEGEVVASIITASGQRIVELTVVFLGIDPGDQARIEQAAGLAVTALSRWDGG